MKEKMKRAGKKKKFLGKKTTTYGKRKKIVYQDFPQNEPCIRRGAGKKEKVRTKSHTQEIV